MTSDLPFDWNDLRYFLAVARTGSTLAASRQLRVSQATVSRRVSILEDALGTNLFSRRPSGYALTPRGSAVLPVAETVESAVQSFADSIAAEQRKVSGIVKVTSVEAAANEWIIPALAQFRELYPDVGVEVLAVPEFLDLSRGEADIAIRFGPKPTQDSLIVRHLLQMEQTAYASEALVARLGLPGTVADLASYPFVVFSGDQPTLVNSWMQTTIAAAEITHRTNSISGIIASMRAGLGASILPCLMGDKEPGLVRLLPPVPELVIPGWMVTTDAARKLPHVRAFLDFVVDVILASVQEVVAAGRGDVARAA